MVRVPTPGLHTWWNDAATWEGAPMDPVWEWLKEERPDSL
jgi:hypothetical protein